jgi:hypothetical protein
MTTNGPPRYRVDHVPVAKLQLVKLMQRAAELGITAEVAGTLRTIVQQLETRPGKWGDPQYDTHLPGGVVLRRWLHPLIVKYAFFEMDRAVLLLEVWAVPGHPLALD